jgi:ferric-dicitrate binding protein FerR (iron transport regulator)
MAGTITSEERAEFMEWYNGADDGQPLDIPKEFATDELTHSFRMYKAIYEKSKEMRERAEAVPVHRIHFLRTAWFRYSAAIILVLAVGVYVFNSKGTTDQVTGQTEQAPARRDVKPPTSVHAMITLADGSKVILDSVSDGTVVMQGNVHIKKLHDGQIVYTGESSNEITYNILNNPAGSKVVQITLSDGTKVWLNSKSSLRYPTAFTGAERLVEVTGETYFEVAANRTPFHVKKDGMEIKVLGTHFNINAYEEEEKIKVTLLEGSLVVSSPSGSVQLEPHEQSQLNSDDQLLLVKGVDTEGVMAWKNGKFDFGEKTDIGTIMRQLARWYNLELEYKGTISQHFGGSISRDVNLSQVLKILETTGGVRFEVEGNKVTVMP